MHNGYIIFSMHCIWFIAAEEAHSDGTHLFACVERNLFSK